MRRSYHSISSLATELRVSRVARVTGLDRTGVEVACAVRPQGHVLQVCNGKGWTWEAAQWSALFEAAELDAAERPGLEWTMESDGEHDERWSSSQLGGATGGTIAFVEARRLGGRGHVKVPLHAVACAPDLPGPVTVSWSSNAMGAHFSRDRALKHALDEAWERHALAQVLPNGWTPRAVAGRRLAVDVPLVQAGFELAVFDLSLGEGPYVAGALLFDREEGPVPLAAGYAARDRLGDAIDAAVLEAAQSRLTDIHAAREDVVTKPGPREVGAFRAEIAGIVTTAPRLRAFSAWWKDHPAAFVELGTHEGIHVVKVLSPALEVSELL